MAEWAALEMRYTREGYRGFESSSRRQRELQINFLFMINIFNRKKDSDPKNLEEVLGCLKRLKKDFKSLQSELEDLKEHSQRSIQKIGIVRFNPFSEIGGDQSFSVALLDEKNNGMVITSLYNQEGSRIYTKPIKSGDSSYSLSQEEKEAISKAINS